MWTLCRKIAVRVSGEVIITLIDVHCWDIEHCWDILLLEAVPFCHIGNNVHNKNM